MVKTLTYSTRIFGVFGALSFLNKSESIWKKLLSMAIDTIKETTEILHKDAYKSIELDCKEAEIELDKLQPFVKTIDDSRILVESLTDNDLAEFKEVTIEFLNAFEMLYDTLQDNAFVHAHYHISTLNNDDDWNSPENDHWDNY